MKESYSIYDLLEQIQKRPAMYIGSFELERIILYLAGYRHAMMEQGVRDESMPDFSGFHEFVRDKFQFPGSSMGWPNLILAKTMGLNPQDVTWENYNQGVTPELHKEAVLEFFRLIDEYRCTEVNDPTETETCI